MPTATRSAPKPLLSNATKVENAVALVDGGDISINKASKMCDVDRRKVKKLVKVLYHAWEMAG